MVNPDLVAFAQALTDSGAVFYGTAWCQACTAQKELFEDGQNLLDFREVTNPDRTLNQVGIDNNISVFPTWILGDGTRIESYANLATLSAASGVAIPTTDAPFLAELADETLLVGSPLHVALDGYDPDGEPLTYTVESDNPDVTAEILTGNRSVRMDVAGYGDMVFELFEQRAPLATGRMIELAEDDFYNDQILHRIIDDFVIQGGDPLGTGLGGSDLGDFDDQFHIDLQHNRTGLLSTANQGPNQVTGTSGDDTNDSQFFITEGDNSNALRNLDYNHTVFGLLVEGEANRAAISDVPTNAENLPDIPVVLNSVEVFEDTENATLFLKAADGATGSANITVTVTDSDGNTSSRTFRVDLQEDPFDSRPFLGPVADQSGPADTPLTFQLTSTDVEGDPVSYAVRAAPGETGATGFTFEVDDAGLVTVTPPNGFTGSIEVDVSVHRENQVSLDGDFQVITVTFT